MQINSEKHYIVIKNMFIIGKLRSITIIAIVILLFSCKGVNNEKPSREETVLIDLGKRYYKEFEEEMKRIERVFKEECDKFDSKHYVIIEQYKDYKGYKLYHINFWIDEEPVSSIIDCDSFEICIKYLDSEKKLIANAGFDYDIDCCGTMFITDYTEWFVLYNDTTNQYIAIRDQGIPLKNILQFNQLLWSDSVYVVNSGLLI